MLGEVEGLSGHHVCGVYGMSIRGLPTYAPAHGLDPSHEPSPESGQSSPIRTHSRTTYRQWRDILLVVVTIFVDEAG